MGASTAVGRIPWSSGRVVGLRQRKKEKLRRDLEKAMLTRVLEVGYAQATVEDVCAEVGISNKTFFNYFDSKDSAILGRVEHTPTAEDFTAAFSERQDESYLLVMADVVMAPSEPQGGDTQIVALRRAVLDKEPQLSFRNRRVVLDSQRGMVEAMRAYLAEHPERRMMPDVDVNDEIMVAVTTAMSLCRMRFNLSLHAGRMVSSEETLRLMSRCVEGAIGERGGE